MPTGQEQGKLELGRQEKEMHKWYKVKQTQRLQLERNLKELEGQPKASRTAGTHQ